MRYDLVLETEHPVQLDRIDSVLEHGTAREALETALEQRVSLRRPTDPTAYVLYDYDADEVVGSMVYRGQQGYRDAVADANELDNVAIVALFRDGDEPADEDDEEEP